MPHISISTPPPNVTQMESSNKDLPGLATKSVKRMLFPNPGCCFDFFVTTIYALSESNENDNDRQMMSLESFQFVDEEIQNLMSAETPLEAGNSFTALLELPPNQAVKLLHSPEGATPNVLASVFSAMKMDNSPEITSSILPTSTHNNSNLVKDEPIESGFLHNSSPIFTVPDPTISKSTKRKDREKKVKSSAKKIKSAAKDTDGEKLPYVHVRARRGEATDSHSLAERARREKINARMKLLQELVPGCNKISGTAMVLDEIINHVQSLQLQVEFLSMKLATVHPIIDINLDSLFSSETMDCNFISPSWWLDGQVNGNTQQIWHHDGHGHGHTNFIKPDNSHLSYDSLGNSGESQTQVFSRECSFGPIVDSKQLLGSLAS